MADGANRIESLVLAFQGGDVGALEQIVEGLRAPLLRIANWIVRDPVAAEDVFIEAMSRLLSLLPDFDKPANFNAYARRTVRNAAVDTIRRRSDRDSLRSLRDTDRMARARSGEPGTFVEGVPGTRPSPEAAAIMSERRDKVRGAVAGLGEPRRTIVELFYQHERSYDEIAEELDTSSATVKRHLAAARVLLAARLRSLEGERLVS